MKVVTEQQLQVLSFYQKSTQFQAALLIQNYPMTGNRGKDWLIKEMAQWRFNIDKAEAPSIVPYLN